MHGRLRNLISPWKLEEDMVEYSTYPMREEVSRIIEHIIERLNKAEELLLLGEESRAKAQIGLCIKLVFSLERRIVAYEKVDEQTADSLKSMDLHDTKTVLETVYNMI